VTILRDLGTFIAGLGVPIVVDGVLREQHTRLEAGVLLGVFGLGAAAFGFLRDRREHVRYVPPGDCPWCRAPLAYIPASPQGHPALFGCSTVSCENGGYYPAARDVKPLLIPGTADERLL
jgi:hypothetical protein